MNLYGLNQMVIKGLHPINIEILNEMDLKNIL